MKSMKRFLLALALTLLAATGLAAAPLAGEKTARWLHVSITSHDASGETLRINLPLSLAEKALPAMSGEEPRKGKVKLGEVQIDGLDLEALLEAIRAAEDNQVVALDTPEETVRVAKAGGYLLVRISQRGRDAEKVSARIPEAVADALFSGEKDELDIGAAVRALAECGDGALATASNRTNTVRIWVDSRSTAP